MNLLTKLVEKIKNIKDETKKRIMATVLAGGIALSGLGMTGCTSCNPNPNDPNTPITNPGDDNGETQTPGNNGGSQNGGSSQNDYSKYSQILQNVLTDPYYYNLEFIHEIDGSEATYNKQKYMAIPYGFLEDEGFDVKKFKDEKLHATSQVYTINNDLFIELRAEIDAGKKVWDTATTYLANYILKYTLTEQEMKEILALYKHMYILHFEKTTYLQAPLFVQELSYLKTPEILSKAYITREALYKTQSYCNDKNFVTNLNAMTYVESKYIPSDFPEYETTFITHSYNLDAVKSNHDIYVLKFTTLSTGPSDTGCVMVDGNQIYINRTATALTLTKENKEIALASAKTGKFLDCSYCYFKNVKDTSIDELLANNN